MWLWWGRYVIVSIFLYVICCNSLYLPTPPTTVLQPLTYFPYHGRIIGVRERVRGKYRTGVAPQLISGSPVGGSLSSLRQGLETDATRPRNRKTAGKDSVRASNSGALSFALNW